MILHDEIIVTPETTVVVPVEHVYKLCPGTITSIVVIPAIGPNWEVYIRFLHLENAFIPNDNTNWIPLEKYMLDFNPLFGQWEDVYQIKCQVCAPQAKFTHNIQVIVTCQEIATIEESFDALLQIGRGK